MFRKQELTLKGEQDSPLEQIGSVVKYNKNVCGFGNPLLDRCFQ